MLDSRMFLGNPCEFSAFLAAACPELRGALRPAYLLSCDRVSRERLLAMSTVTLQLSALNYQLRTKNSQINTCTNAVRNCRRISTSVLKDLKSRSINTYKKIFVDRSIAGNSRSALGV